MLLLVIFPKFAPIPGDRLPYVVFKNEKEENIQEYITATMMELLVFEEDTIFLEKLNPIIEKYKNIIHTTVVKKDEVTKEVFDKFGITAEGYYLVRPDMYIAYRSQGIQPEHFENYLKQFFTVLSSTKI